MKSTSSLRRAVALLSVRKCSAMAVGWPTAAGAEAGSSDGACASAEIYAAPDLPDRFGARGASTRFRRSSLRSSGSGGFPSRWSLREDPSAGELPVPDDAALRRIAEKVFPRLRADGEGRARRRFVASRRGREGMPVVTGSRRRRASFLAEIFLRRGILRLWEGKVIRRRGALFPACGHCGLTSHRYRPCSPPRYCPYGRRSGAAPYPKRNSWSNRSLSGARSSSTESVGESLPRAFETGKIAPGPDPRLTPGYRDAETTGQWLPGDTEIVRFSLPGDRGGSSRRTSCRRRAGKGGSAGPLVGENCPRRRDLADRDPDARKEPAGEGLRGRLYAGRPANRDPALLGETSFPAGKGGRRSPESGSPMHLPRTGGPDRNRRRDHVYFSPWFWGIVLAVGAAAAFGAGGGGGGSGRFPGRHGRRGFFDHRSGLGVFGYDVPRAMKRNSKTDRHDDPVKGSGPEKNAGLPLYIAAALVAAAVFISLFRDMGSSTAGGSARRSASFGRGRKASAGERAAKAYGRGSPGQPGGHRAGGPTACASSRRGRTSSSSPAAGRRPQAPPKPGAKRP